MTTGAIVDASHLDWMAASRPMPGHQTSGDVHVVEEWAGGALVAVVDGVGHGQEAALAARRAEDALRAHRQEPLGTLMTRCHRALAGTRGAVISMATFDFGEARMSWVGVGNVEGTLLRGNGRARAGLLLRPGVVGDRLPSLGVSVVEVGLGDMLVLATDGIRSDFVSVLDPDEPPGRLAERVLAEYARDTDDGLVVVARYVGR